MPRNTPPRRRKSDALAKRVPARSGQKIPAASSPWFSVAKRFFLYGGPKEFNTSTGALDRILDYSIALEAVLMCETHCINRLMQCRAVALLSIPEDKTEQFSRSISRFYEYRSTIARGEPRGVRPGSVGG